jgi:hypothetical protein
VRVLVVSVGLAGLSLIDLALLAHCPSWLTGWGPVDSLVLGVAYWGLTGHLGTAWDILLRRLRLLRFSLKPSKRVKWGAAAPVAKNRDNESDRWTQNRSFLYGTVRPRVISECGNRTTQGLLLLKHALTQRDQNFTGHFTWHCSVHPTGATVELCSSGLASERSTISRYGAVARACMCLHHSLELRSMRRCNRAIRSWKERSGSSTTLIDLAVHEYPLTCVHIHSTMNNEFHIWCSCRTRTTSRIRALEPDFVYAR